MEEEKKREIATFRFGVISDLVVSHTLERGEREKLLREKAERQWLIPYSRRTRISGSTLALWVRRYERSGRKLESLYPQGRADMGQSRALDEEVAQSLINLKKEHPRASIQALIRMLQERKLIDSWAKICPTTVYRFLKSQGLWDVSPPAVKDRRRFEAELPNDLWQSDMMYGPMVKGEGRQRKTFLFAFLDDMSRLIPHAQFYLSEGLENYLDCLRQASLRRGLPRRLYVDNGPTFRSQHLAQITASLGIALIHSTPYQPEGRGKVERWFRTVREDFLPRWRGAGFRGSESILAPVAGGDLPSAGPFRDHPEAPGAIFRSPGVCAAGPPEPGGFLPQAGPPECGQRPQRGLKQPPV